MTLSQVTGGLKLNTVLAHRQTGTQGRNLTGTLDFSTEQKGCSLGQVDQSSVNDSLTGRLEIKKVLSQKQIGYILRIFHMQTETQTGVFHRQNRAMIKTFTGRMELRIGFSHKQTGATNRTPPHVPIEQDYLKDMQIGAQDMSLPKVPEAQTGLQSKR